MRLPYLLVSFVTWALFVLHETAASLPVDSYVLSPRAVQRTWNRVVALGFPFLELTMCTIVDKLGSFVAEHPHTDFELRDTDLTATEAPSRTVAGSFNGATADKPHEQVEHIHQLTFSSMVSLVGAKYSLLPLCTYEFIMGPRTICTEACGQSESRFNKAAQYTQIISKLLVYGAMIHCSLAPLSK